MNSYTKEQRIGKWQTAKRPLTIVYMNLKNSTRITYFEETVGPFLILESKKRFGIVVFKILAPNGVAGYISQDYFYY